MRDVATTILDALGLCLLAAGVGLGVYGLIVGAAYGPPGWAAAARGAGLVAAGIVIFVGSWLADRSARAGEPVA